jgi:hypothetical protein
VHALTNVKVVQYQFGGIWHRQVEAWLALLTVIELLSRFRAELESSHTSHAV